MLSATELLSDILCSCRHGSEKRIFKAQQTGAFFSFTFVLDNNVVLRYR